MVDNSIVLAAVAWENSRSLERQRLSLNPKKFRRYYREEFGDDMDNATLSAIRNECIRIRDLRRRREMAKRLPVQVPLRTRLQVLRAKRAIQSERQYNRRTRETLKYAARIARSLGANVRSSKFDGQVSSYYCRLPNGVIVRISDHLIPPTETRIAKHGDSYNGFDGPQIIIDGDDCCESVRSEIERLFQDETAAAVCT